MTCRTLEPRQVDEERAHLEQSRRYVPGEEGRTSVQFRFNLDPSRYGDSLLLIYSNRIRSSIYWGSYRSVLSVDIDSRLTSKKGGDNLEFWLLRLRQREICVWNNESDYPYWRPDAVIGIDFLWEAVLDEYGLPKDHEVTLR
jgi:hypothetical protein